MAKEHILTSNGGKTLKGFKNRYVVGDSRVVLTNLPRACIDVTITSPPYWNLKDYRSKDQIGYGQSYAEFLRSLGKVFELVYRATKSSGSLWIVADTVKRKGQLILFPFDLARQLGRIGWNLQDIIIWHKDKTLPWSHRGKLRNIFEYILFFSKSNTFKYYLPLIRNANDLKEWWVRYPERYSPQGKAPTRNWVIPIPRQGSWGEVDNWVRHFCPFPPDLVRRIMLLTTRKGDIVLDPFCGSGVVLAQAKALGRDFIGVDLRKSYRKMFASKVLPSLSRAERASHSNQENAARRRRKFAHLIWRLRKTKYARELIRLYRMANRRQRCRAAFAFSRGKRALDIYFILKSKAQFPGAVTRRLSEISRRPPLSKYGIRASFHYLTVDGIKRHFHEAHAGTRANGIWAYRNGRTHTDAQRISLEALLKELRNGTSSERKYPLIVSNVRVNASTEALTNGLD